MQNTVTFPDCFSEAKNKLRMRFRNVSSDIIDDGIQHAKIQYWRQNISASIPDANKAFGWFLNAAICYVYKEKHRTRRNCDISLALNFYSCDPERSYIYRDWLNVFFPVSRSGVSSSPALNRAMGFTLKEQAEATGISAGAMKQKHSREKRKLQREVAILFS